MAVITDGQLEIAGELVIGADTDFALPVNLMQWWTAPEVRSNDFARAGSDGYQMGRDLLGKHTTTLIVQILADSEAELADRFDEWKSACRVTPDTVVALRACLLGQTRVRFGRFRIPGEVLIDEWALVQQAPLRGPCERLVAQGSAQFVVVDARTYGDTLNTVSTTRTLPGSGFTPPFLVPFTLGESVDGVCVAYNAGNRSAPWTARLDGPLGYPAITHVESGRRLSLALTANGGVILEAGQWITLDSATRSVLLNDTADRRMNLTIDSDWWELSPGDNTFQLDADTGSGQLSVAWRDAWLS